MHKELLEEAVQKGEFNNIYKIYTYSTKQRFNNISLHIDKKYLKNYLYSYFFLYLNIILSYHRS